MRLAAMLRNKAVILAEIVCPELADYPTLEEEFNIPAPGEVK
ncbi:hypothetical protein BiPBO1_75 [Brucella phage BiPBO1]|nr:hypothetical protein BJD47_gp75 [Brucella phage BiPBO1]ALJ98289.1 hypothetical protein BiPBO1_75 [Brucella phage BiPBO1]